MDSLAGHKKGLFTTSKFPYSHATDIPESNLSGCCQHVKYSCSHCRLQTPSSSLSNNSSNTLPIIWVNFAPKQTSVFRKLVLKQENLLRPLSKQYPQTQRAALMPCVYVRKKAKRKRSWPCGKLQAPTLR